MHHIIIIIYIVSKLTAGVTYI